MLFGSWTGPPPTMPRHLLTASPWCIANICPEPFGIMAYSADRLPPSADNARSVPSAGSGGLLCERLDERAAVMVAQPALKLGGGELAVRLDHGPLAVHPLGLDRVQPRALARQAAGQQAAAAAGGLDPAVVGPDP